MRRDKRDKEKDREKDRHALLAAAALQDHMARRLRMPGGPVVQPSLQPGAPLTLAQHLGLIPRPPPLLTEDQWTEVHLRSRLRQDSAAECVICREEFQAGAQVLLSCSHTFHRHCLAAFERYSRCKTCPLCRAEQYQKRVIRDGERMYRSKCATRIQAAWRGYAARKRYRELRRHNPPKDERLRKKWAAERLQEENDRLLSAMDDEVGDLDDLFAELDASVAQSRAVCDAALRPLAARLERDMRLAEAQSRAAARGQPPSRPSTATSGRGLEERGSYGPGARAAAPALVESSSVAVVTTSAAGAPAAVASRWLSSSSSSSHSDALRSGGRGGDGGGLLAAAAVRPASAAADVDWDTVVARARTRGSPECPICLGDIARRGNEGISWLSCTHCFHVDCIMAFEAFELASGGHPTCPVCRSAYRRRCFA